MEIDGACHCGKVSFTALIDPDKVMVCHCNDCQVLSGAPMRAVVPVMLQDMTLHGEPKRYIKTAQSGNKRAQVFCSDCGTPLFATAAEAATSVILRLGCVRQRHQLTPKLHIWHDEAMPWNRDTHGVPTSPNQSGFLAPAPAPR